MAASKIANELLYEEQKESKKQRKKKKKNQNKVKCIEENKILKEEIKQLSVISDDVIAVKP